MNINKILIQLDSFMFLCILDEELAASKPSTGIVTWNILKEKIPWGLLFLLGKFYFQKKHFKNFSIN